MFVVPPIECADCSLGSKPWPSDAGFLLVSERTTGARHMIVEVRGKKLSVEKQGTGEPVVLLHGLGSSANVWEPQVRALADRFTLIRYDLEGAGRSPYAGELSIASHVEDLAAIMDANN